MIKFLGFHKLISCHLKILLAKYIQVVFTPPWKLLVSGLTEGLGSRVCGSIFYVVSQKSPRLTFDF